MQRQVVGVRITPQRHHRWEVGNYGKRNADGTFTNASSGDALADSTKGSNRMPKDERERQRVRFRGLRQPREVRRAGHHY